MKKIFALLSFVVLTAPLFIQAMEPQKANSVEVRNRTIQSKLNQSIKIVTMKIPSGMTLETMNKASREDMRTAYCCATAECCLCLGTTYCLYNQLPLLHDNPTYFEYLKVGLTSLCGYGNTCFCHKEAKTACQNAVNMKYAAAVIAKTQAQKNNA